MECLKNDSGWKAAAKGFWLPSLKESCLEYARAICELEAEYAEDDEEDDDEELFSRSPEADGEKLYRAVIDLYPMADPDKWYFDVMFWDADFDFFLGWPGKTFLPVTGFDRMELRAHMRGPQIVQ